MIKKKRAFLYVPIALTIVMLFTANSAVAAGWGTSYCPSFTDATKPHEMLDSDDDTVGSLGEVGDPTGRAMILFSTGFYLGEGDDITVYGLDVDDEEEEYMVQYGHHENCEIGYISVWAGFASDADDEVSFNASDSGGPYNFIMLTAISGVNGTLPGPEIDAVYTHH